ncbi:hypothetical protein AVEN_209506-1 [Araneus ventricosus]|uniref:Uncharacterized protein n=1 Tax=Araneus ventricosus TaxID=182803 RepID=A0A4Y2IQK4_ARAVE|nr:hypothetical protein AVEN_209506-1 [Araneus ventricosus]
MAIVSVGLMHAKSDVGQTSSRWCDMEIWRGMRYLRCRPYHLNAVQNYEARPKNSPRVVSKRHPNMTKLNQALPVPNLRDRVIIPIPSFTPLSVCISLI